MRFNGLFAAALTCISLVQPAWAADKDDTAKKPKNYAEAAEECEKAIERRTHELASDYSSDVWSLKQKYQKHGDLEKALAADKEWSRSLARKPLTQEDLVDEPLELKTLQIDYLSRFGNVAENVATEFLSHLAKEASELAKAGKLADGKVLQQEIDTIKQLYLAGRDNKPRTDGRAETKTEGDVITAFEEVIRQKRVALQVQYVGELEAMEKSFQSQGLLEDLFAVKAEHERYVEAPILAATKIVEKPEALRQLQQKYLELNESLVALTADEFITQLEEQKKSLTIEGKLDEAVKAKNAIEQVRLRVVSQNKANGKTAGKPKDRLGNVCFFKFDDWDGVWRRRVGTNIFDCEMRHRHGPTCTYTATISVDGKTAAFKRTNSFHSQVGRESDTEYTGEISADGKRITWKGFGYVEARP